VNSGFWLLASGFWLLASGFQLLAFGSQENLTTGDFLPESGTWELELASRKLTPFIRKL
jgi:hypothetical protein